MINIAICDDLPYWVSDTRKKCEEVLRDLGQTYNIIDFSSGEEVIAYTGEKIHLLFLDIEMNGMSGLDVMEQIQNNPLFWRIVFVTGHDNYYGYTIDIKTLAFLSKPVVKDDIKRCFRAVLREAERNRKITIETTDGDISFSVEEIVYIHAKEHYVTIYSNGKETEGYLSLKKLEDILKDTSIIRSHKSFLVNLLYVKDVIWGKVILLSGETVPLGRSYYQKSRDAFFQFIKKMSIERLI
jgi:DNA-binding LytR/AlgR family response regulator